MYQRRNPTKYLNNLYVKKRKNTIGGIVKCYIQATLPYLPVNLHG